MYSTVGASQVRCRSLVEFLAEGEVKSWCKSATMAVERAENGMKDVVKMVAFQRICPAFQHLNPRVKSSTVKFTRTAAENLVQYKHQPDSFSFSGAGSWPKFED